MRYHVIEFNHIVVLIGIFYLSSVVDHRLLPFREFLIIVVLIFSLPATSSRCGPFILRSGTIPKENTKLSILPHRVFEISLSLLIRAAIPNPPPSLDTSGRAGCWDLSLTY